jgi:hypothetical protein
MQCNTAVVFCRIGMMLKMKLGVNLSANNKSIIGL